MIPQVPTSSGTRVGGSALSAARSGKGRGTGPTPTGEGVRSKPHAYWGRGEEQAPCLTREGVRSSPWATPPQRLFGFALSRSHSC